MTSPRAGSPTRQEVEDELRRVVERWRQLPLDHALSRMPSVQALVQSLADRVAETRHAPQQRVPDLGPGVVMDQLTVMVHDVLRAGPAAGGGCVVAELAGIRRSL